MTDTTAVLGREACGTCKCCRSAKQDYNARILAIQSTHSQALDTMRHSIQDLMLKYEKALEKVEEASIDARKHALASSAAAGATRKHLETFQALNADAKPSIPVDTVIDSLSQALTKEKTEHQETKQEKARLQKLLDESQRELLSVKEIQYERIEEMVTSIHELKARIGCLEGERRDMVEAIDEFDAKVARDSETSYPSPIFKDTSNLTHCINDIVNLLRDEKFSNGRLQEENARLRAELRTDLSETEENIKKCILSGLESLDNLDKYKRIDIDNISTEDLIKHLVGYGKFCEASIESLSKRQSELKVRLRNSLNHTQTLSRQASASLETSSNASSFENEAMRKSRVIHDDRPHSPTESRVSVAMDEIRTPEVQQMRPSNVSFQTPDLVEQKEQNASLQSENDATEELKKFKELLTDIEDRFNALQAMSLELDKLQKSNQYLTSEVERLTEDQKETTQNLSFHTNPSQKLHYLRKVKGQLDILKKELSKVILENYEHEQCIKYLCAKYQMHGNISSLPLRKARDALSPLSIAGSMHDLQIDPSTLANSISKDEWQLMNDKRSIEKRIKAKILAIGGLDL